MGKALSLKEYQQGAYRTEKSELNEALSLITSVLPLYMHVFLKDRWPYIAKNKEELPPHESVNYSNSTNVMIMVMLLDICKKIGFTNEDKWIEKNITAAKDTYFKKVFEQKNEFKNSSESYGINDPLNLYWAYTICAEGDEKDRLSIVKKIIEDKICKEDGRRELNCLLDFGNEKNFEQQEHSFIALYAYRCARKAECHEKITERYYNFFELRLHQHLSFKSIPDSRFDPAELVFCLEGMLLSKPSSVSAEILHRVFEVLGEAQNITPCWRPVNPIYATQQGQIFLPLSIEVGMSLLNIFYIIDNFSGPQSYFAKYFPMLQRYFRWLKAQKKNIQLRTYEKQPDNSVEGAESSNTNKEVYIGISGWESEHVGTDEVIHLWQTVLILDYLASYTQLLKKHIGQQYLTHSGLCVEYYEHAEKCTSCFFRNSNPFPEYDEDSEFKFNLPNYVLKHFLLKRKLDSKPYDCCPPRKTEDVGDVAYSLLLFGPPGTGKTFFTKQIATCLKWKHITVTPSDFLADGSAEIESRAKGIFSCLMEQENAVILFDEIDQFILNRDSKRYREQTDIFKLLTPGMLPKFQNLRDNAKCIFIIATNYADRIDPAVVRLGRVDLQVPLMPPSWEKRKLICKKVVDTFGKDEFKNYDFSRIADHTRLLTWKELTTLLKGCLQKGNVENLESCIKKETVLNLSFSKVLQRIESEDGDRAEQQNGKKQYMCHGTIIEELVSMCMAYGKETREGLKCFAETFTDYKAIIKRVSKEVNSRKYSVKAR